MLTQRLLRTTVPLSLLCIGGCISHAPSFDALPSHEYRGHYTSGDRASWFRACGAAPADSAWWATITGEAVAQMDSARQAGGLRDGEPSYVDWLAAVTTSGETGPRGAGAPALLVRKIVALRPAAAGDCADAR